MDDFKMDWERIARTGTSEAVLCEPNPRRRSTPSSRTRASSAGACF